MMSSQDAQFGGDTGIDADYQYEHDQLNELESEPPMQFLNIDNPKDMLRWEKRIDEPWGITDAIPRCPYNYENENCSCPKFQATAGDID